MKGFNRANLGFSLCGLNCGLCPMYLDKHCPGCGGGVGNQSCSIAKCSLQHEEVEYCFLCPEYPCGRYERIEAYDSFITHQRQLSDIAKAQKAGIEAYSKEQTQKAKILQKLLSDYNDERRKTFYCVAVNLLPLHNIESAMKQVVEDAAFDNLTIKEKADHIAALFKNHAIQYGLELRLRKKPNKK